MPSKKYYWSKRYQNYLKRNKTKIREYNIKYLRKYHTKWHTDPEYRKKKNAYENKRRKKTGHYQENRQRFLDYQKRQALKHPEKINARALVNRALKKRILNKKPCEKCGVLKVEGHHPDYSKPLRVIWLCRKHHIELHKALRQTNP